MDINNEQLMAILQMQDLSAEEQNMLRQQQQSQMLREGGMRPSAGKDFGSQAARAMQGIGGAIGSYRDKQAMDEFSRTKRGTLGLMGDVLMGNKARFEKKLGPNYSSDGQLTGAYNPDS